MHLTDKACAITFGLLTLIMSTVVAEDQDSPQSPQDAANGARVPRGVTVTPFASEPDVMQPIGFCLDDRARLWVAEAYNYPRHGTEAGDRIVILEDTDGDGKHDKRKVFYDGLNYVTGIEVGFGGVWVMTPPYFYFIPDRDQNDQPDGPPELLLDGFGNHDNAHNLANGFAWGPDGWLYGTHGRTNWSMIGKPGTPENERVRFDGGVYRYHPVHHMWEPYADGTTNPWGIDWNDYGHAFMCNCVNPHLFQVIQGAHYEPWRGRKSSEYAYQRIETIADHLHFTGLSNIRHGKGSAEEDAAGGGHAHCGTMIYLGDSFPARFRNSLFTNNVHGRRINNDLLQRRGSGYVGTHGPDLLRATDPWFMGVTLAYGPSGEIYVSDWSDTGECHSTKNTRRATGRIYRMTYGRHQLPSVNMKTSTSDELVDFQMHKNDWFVRHARRLLQERFRSGQDMSTINKRLWKLFEENDDVTRKLRAIWALNVTGGIDETFLHSVLHHDSEHIRSWAVTLLAEEAPSDETIHRFVQLAMHDNSSLVRLSLASALQRIALPERWGLATALAGRGEDETDQNLPLMIWYGIEPLIEENLPQYIKLGENAKLSRVRINIARRVASLQNSDSGLNLLAGVLAGSIDDTKAHELLTGIMQGIEGKRDLAMPENWQSAFHRLSQTNDPAVHQQAIRLAIVFKDQAAMSSLRLMTADQSEPAEDRVRAIDALVGQRIEGFGQELIRLIDDPLVRMSAIRGLASYNTPQTASSLLKLYPKMSAAEQQQAQVTLTSREAWASDLIDAIDAKSFEASDLTAFTARQIRALGNESLTAKLTSHWGDVRATPRDKAMQISSIKKWLTTEKIAQADLEHGGQLFTKHCATCHRLFGEGGTIGPDITGAQRTNLDYMLENIIDPSAAVAKDYQMHVVQTDDGRVVTGLIETESEQTLVMQTATERLVFPASEIVARKKSEVSMMPQGMLEPLSENEVRDLMGYLQKNR